jgi:hypothetical protein
VTEIPTGKVEQSVYRRNPEVSFTRFGDEMLVVVPKLSWQLVLNGTGARVFELLDGRASIAAIAGTIAGEFADGPTAAEVVDDVRGVLTDLEEKGAVQPVG